MREKIKTSTLIFKGALKEIGANLVAAQLYPLGLFERNLAPRPHTPLAKNPNPILLVHGVIHNRSAFRNLKNHMERQGWENVFALNYNTFHGNILQMVEELGQKIQVIQKKTSATQIDIVAHSLGGIVARTYMTLGDGRGKVRRLVTLGTPHQGTRLSIFAKGLSRGALDADLKVDSYLIRLLKSTSLPKSSEIVSIYSPFDWTVIPTDSARCKGKPASSFKNISLDYVGHLGLLYSSKAYEAIIESILKP